MKALAEDLVQQSWERGVPSVSVGGPALCQALLELGGQLAEAASPNATTVRGERAGRRWSVELYADEPAAGLRRAALEGGTRLGSGRFLRSRARVHSLLLGEEDERRLRRLMELHGRDAAEVVAAGLRALDPGADAGP